jgi:hypothetical protein
MQPSDIHVAVSFPSLGLGMNGLPANGAHFHPVTLSQALLSSGSQLTLNYLFPFDFVYPILCHSPRAWIGAWTLWVLSACLLSECLD